MKTLGLFLGSCEDGYGQDLIRGAQAACQDHGVRLVCITSGTLNSVHGFDAQRNLLYHVITTSSIDGILVSGALSHNAGQAELEAFCQRYAAIPVVTISLKLPGFPGVLTDSRRSLESLVDHVVLHHQRRRPALLGGPLGQQEAEDRKRIIQERLAVLGISLPRSHVVHGNFTRQSGEQAARKLLDNGIEFDALISVNDSMALGAMSILQERGIDIPGSVSITGYDDDVDGRYAVPSLTTIRQSPTRHAYSAAQTAIRAIMGKGQEESLTVESRLVLRRSCGCASADEIKPRNSLEKAQGKNEAASRMDLPIMIELQEQLEQEWRRIQEEATAEYRAFARTFQTWAHLVADGEHDPVSEWQDLCRRLGPPDRPAQSLALIHGSATMLDSMTRLRAMETVRNSRIDEQVRGLRESLLSTFDLADVLEVLAKGIPRLGFNAFWLNLFPQPHDLATAQNRLSLVALETGIHAQEGPLFPSELIIPGGFSSLGPSDFPFMVIEALYSRDVHLGFMVLAGPQVLSRHTGTLRTQISGALYGSLLLSQKDQAVDQLLASEKAAALGNLVAGIAHEINTPIGVSLSAATFLKARSTQVSQALGNNSLTRSNLDQLLEQLGESSDIIAQNLLRAADLINSFKHVAADQTSDIRRPFALREYLEETLVSLKPHTKQYAKVKIAVEGPDDLRINSYPGAVAQIVTNLVMNSFLHAFGHEQAGHCVLRVEDRDSHARLVFTDNGSGISPEVLPHIFDPFFTTKRGQGGTGLGLHIIRNLVERHLGGQVSCQSRVGEGTTFIFDLPKESPEASSLSALPDTADPSSRSATH